MTTRAHPDADAFSLDRVSWGYRKLFQDAIEQLRREGRIGPERREVTDRFFAFLAQSQRRCFDHVVKEFLDALQPANRWVFDAPGLFSRVVDMGQRLADLKIHYGVTYFKILGRGGFGDGPAHAERLLARLPALLEISPDLALALLRGYRRLVDRLEPDAIDQYIDEALQVYARSPRSGVKFLEGALRSSDAAAEMLSRESRLDDEKDKLEKLLKSLTGVEMKVERLSRLDSDELIGRGTSVVCLYRWLYLPDRVRVFERREDNRRWRLLQAVVAAGMMVEDSFCKVHGHPEFKTCRALVGDSALALNVFQIAEAARVLRRMRRRWPGARRLLEFGVREEFARVPPAGPAERLLFDALTDAPAAAAVLELADRSPNCFFTARAARGEWAGRLAQAYPGLDKTLLRASGFLPDFLYPGETSAPPSDALVADLKSQAASGDRDARGDAGEGETGRGEAAGETDDDSAPAAGYLYDEWAEPERDYYARYCCVRETRPAEAPAAPAPAFDHARYVRRLFERIKPDLARKEKFLQDGDDINHDLLVEYLVNKRREPAPRVNFHEKPLIQRRDLAVLLLLDVSGSTSEAEGERKVIELEKTAAAALGEGLASLGDRFAICGFSSRGRLRCEFLVFKDFDEPWDDAAMRRVMAAQPRGATRMGAALRHAGYRLRQTDARRKLLLLITDGKPQDADYDPSTHYAQHDVRMACVENRRLGVHTFCISTRDNTEADLDVMFPDRRYVTLRSLRDLPDALPRLYLKWTR